MSDIPSLRRDLKIRVENEGDRQSTEQTNMKRKQKLEDKSNAAAVLPADLSSSRGFFEVPHESLPRNGEKAVYIPTSPGLSSSQSSHSTLLHQPSPLRHALSPPPPSYEYPTQSLAPDHISFGSPSSTQSQHGDSHHRQRSATTTTTTSSHAALDDKLVHHRRRSATTTSDFEMSHMKHDYSYSSASDRHFPLELQTLHEDSVPLNPNHYVVHQPEVYPERVTITLTANMTLPYRDEMEPADSRAGYILSKERQSALAEVDAAHFSWFHFKVCLIAGVGFFTDAYDIFAINLASVMPDFVYQPSPPSHINRALANAVKIAAPLGTFIGQLLFGWLADRTGRKRMYGIELIIIIIGTFGQALSANGSVGTMNIFAALIIWRFVMGLGIGGDYPLSAVISSEFASSHIRGRMMTAVFANQGWGQLCASLIGFFVLMGFRNSFHSLSASSDDPGLKMAIDRTWRLLLGLGCIPAAIALYFRLTIPETPRYTMDIERNVKQATKDIETFLNTGKYQFDEDSIIIRVNAPKASFRDFRLYFSRMENLKLLFACAYAWFAVDVAFYGVGLNTDTLFCSIGIARSVIGCTIPDLNGSKSGISAQLSTDITASNVFRDLIDLAVANLLFSGVGLIPGYWVTFLVIEKWGRKRIQLMGFAVLAVLFVIMGAIFPHIGISSFSEPPSSEPSWLPLFGTKSGTKAMLFLFCLAGFFMNFGPNTTTFMIPGELFPTRYRSTCHGISAASGKIGAILSQFLIAGNPNLSTANALFVFVPFMVTGFLATLLLDETSQMTLEDMTHEQQQHFISGVIHQGKP